MSLQPAVSVILTCYNHERYIEESITSIINQTMSDFELLIIDDGSTDHSIEIIQSIADPRLRIIQQTHSGPSEALNRGITEASGKLIAFMSGDDVSVPERLELQLELLQTKNIDLLFSLPIIIGPDSKILSPNFCHWFFGKTFSNNIDLLRLFFYQSNFICAPSGFCRKKSLDKVGKFRRGMLQLQDFDYWLRALKKNQQIHLMQKPVIKYRYLHGENLSSHKHLRRVQMETLAIYRSFFEGMEPTAFREAFNEYLPFFSENGILREHPKMAQAFLFLRHPDMLVKTIGYEMLINNLDDDTVYQRLMNDYQYGTIEFFNEACSLKPHTKNPDKSNGDTFPVERDMLVHPDKKENTDSGELLHRAKEMYRQVDIVIPIYGQSALLKRCVESVLDTTGNAHIILVDDQSPGSEIEHLFSTWKGHPRITMVRTARNSGFIGATRLGAGLGKAPFILFLNSDTEAIEKGWLEKMIPEEDDVAVVGVRLLHPPDAPAPLTGTIQHAGVACNNKGIPYHPFLGRSADLAEANETRDVNAVTGACFLVRRSTWEDLNGWNPIFQRGVYEDVDFCWRVRGNGLRVRYEPSVRLYHHGSASESPDGHHSLNEHLSENLSNLLKLWPNQASDEYLFFGKETIAARRRASSLTEKAKRHLSEGNMKAAVQAMQNAVRAAPESQEALIGYAQLLSQQKKLGKAADQLRTALETSPTNWSARVLLIDVLLADHEAQSAWEQIQMMEHHFPRKAEIMERRQLALELDPSLAIPERPTLSEKLLDDLLNAPVLATILEERSDQLDENLLELVNQYVDEAMKQGNEEVASAMRNLAVYIENKLAADRNPLAGAAPEQLLDSIMSAEDTEHALKQAEPYFDSSFLKYLKIKGSAALDQGDTAAASAYRELAEYTNDILNNRSGNDDSDQAEALLQEILEAEDITSFLKQNQDRLSPALLKLTVEKIAEAERLGLEEVASSLRNLEEYLQYTVTGSLPQD